MGAHLVILDDGQPDLDGGGARPAPALLPIWRSCYAPNKWGLSWSTDRDTAARFSTIHRYRQEGQPILVRAIVERDRIIALKHDRDEAEIIAWRPKHISTSHLPIAAPPGMTSAKGVG